MKRKETKTDYGRKNNNNIKTTTLNTHEVTHRPNNTTQQYKGQENRNEQRTETEKLKGDETKTQTSTIKK